jgi:hypothetical protein
MAQERAASSQPCNTPHLQATDPERKAAWAEAHHAPQSAVSFF